MTQHFPSSTTESPSEQHREESPDSVPVAVLTLSDTRGPDDDRSGAMIREFLTWRGHSVVAYEILPDDPDTMRDLLTRWIANPAISAIITNGGTGISSRDSTHDVVAGLLDKTLDGFGELFRMISWQEIGAAAMLSRAIAGSVGATAIFALPGSSNAVRLAMEKLIGPELSHVVYELKKHRSYTHTD
ncbi:MAG: MogA/MoaB family molybdenum cofactor biosynthesis protein [Chloroflexia bacterium]|jgi:molybdenum cofactor biosynthesis protein B|nr:MogA/MoaB family molybdenum cofactor biosynthesis protein [Chloroflexia bacterium]